MIKKLLLASTLLTALATSALAWDLDKMNKQIDETNVVLGADSRGFCSGTIISVKNRLISTANHCVKDNVTTEEKEITDPDTGEIKKIKVVKKLPLEVWKNKKQDFEVVSSQKYTVKILKQDKEHDTALLQVIATDYVAPSEAPLAPDDYVLKRGETVYVVGNPHGEEFADSVSKGIVSNTERVIDFGDGKIKLFQTDAAVIGGNSGGSIVNEKGELIGTTDAVVNGSSISFGVPIQFTKQLLKDAGFNDVVDKSNIRLTPEAFSP